MHALFYAHTLFYLLGLQNLFAGKPQALTPIQTTRIHHSWIIGHRTDQGRRRASSTLTRISKSLGLRGSLDKPRWMLSEAAPSSPLRNSISARLAYSRAISCRWVRVMRGDPRAGRGLALPLTRDRLGPSLHPALPHRPQGRHQACAHIPELSELRSSIETMRHLNRPSYREKAAFRYPRARNNARNETPNRSAIRYCWKALLHSWNRLIHWIARGPAMNALIRQVQTATQRAPKAMQNS